MSDLSDSKQDVLTLLGSAPMKNINFVAAAMKISAESHANLAVLIQFYDNAVVHESSANRK